MASSNNQQIQQPMEFWTVSKLAVVALAGFKCKSPIKDTESAHRLIRAVWDNGKLNAQEQMMVFFISFDKRIVEYHAAFMATVDRTYGNSRYILNLALHTFACSVILVQNHISGSLVPSPDEMALPKRIQSDLDLIEVKLLDHVIINEKAFFSMSGQGLI